MIIKKIKHPYKDENISKSKKPKNTSKVGKELCFLISPLKRRLDESKEDWAVRFLKTIATSSSEASDKKMNQS